VRPSKGGAPPGMQFVFDCKQKISGKRVRKSAELMEDKGTSYLIVSTCCALFCIELKTHVLARPSGSHAMHIWSEWGVFPGAGRSRGHAGGGPRLRTVRIEWANTQESSMCVHRCQLLLEYSNEFPQKSKPERRQAPPHISGPSTVAVGTRGAAMPLTRNGASVSVGKCRACGGLRRQTRRAMEKTLCPIH
jgi:hypothetical protein